MVTTRARLGETLAILATGAVLAAGVAYAADTDPDVGTFRTITTCTDAAEYPCVDPAGSDLSMIGDDGFMHDGCSVILTGPDTSRLSCRDGYVEDNG